jgi:endonuclease YncB( thermonuclease family)
MKNLLLITSFRRLRTFGRFFVFIMLALAFYSCSSISDSSKDCECKNPIVDSVAVVDCIGVADGDTWKFELKGEQFSVRVLHVDCFETRRGSRLDKQAEAAGITPDSALVLGNFAKHLADSLMAGRKVMMVRDYDEPNLDAFGRLLRITIVDGMRLDSLMLAEGFALEYE